MVLVCLRCSLFLLLKPSNILVVSNASNMLARLKTSGDCSITLFLPVDCPQEVTIIYLKRMWSPNGKTLLMRMVENGW